MFRPLAVLVLTLAVTAPAVAGEWTRFRGPNGTGLAPDANPPATWSDDSNLLWKTPLPGPGASSPVVAEDEGKVFLTCYTGYATPDADGADLRSLVRHLLCFDLATGEELWRQSVPADSPKEDSYKGFITEHGYASNTPAVGDGRVFAFFGKSGVFAYTTDGEPLWNKTVGTDSAENEWGSACSPVLHDGTLYVAAFDESRSLFAVDAATGEQLWNVPLGGEEGTTYGSPVLVDGGDGDPLLLFMLPNLTVAYELADGSIAWSIENGMNRNISNSAVVGAVAGAPAVFVSGGFRGEESLMLKTARGLSAADRVVWRSKDAASVSSAIWADGRLFWLSSGGIAYTVDVATGETLDKARVGNLVLGRHATYASPGLAGGTIFLPTRQGGTLVIEPAATYTELGRNDFASDETDFNATPAVAGDTFLIRSNAALYRIGTP